MKMPDVVEPCFRAALESFQDRKARLRDLAWLVLPELTAGPVQQVQIRLQRHRQTAFIAGSSHRRFLTDSLSRRFQWARSQPACFLTLFGPNILGVNGSDLIR